MRYTDHKQALIAKIDHSRKTVDSAVQTWERALDCTALRVVLFYLGKLEAYLSAYSLVYGEDKDMEEMNSKYQQIWQDICTRAAEFRLVKELD